MITQDQYVGIYAGDKNWTPERQRAAVQFLFKANNLIGQAEAAGIVCPIDVDTGSQVSGNIDGGFRGSTSKTGKKTSAHCEGRAVDVSDPKGALDDFITRNPEVLKKHGLYREHPSATIGWCHLTDRSPKSGNRSFYP